MSRQRWLRFGRIDDAAVLPWAGREAAEVTRKYGLHMLGEYEAMWVEGDLFVTNSGTSVTAGDPFATTR
jgi:hypothetical protein